MNTRAKANVYGLDGKKTGCVDIPSVFKVLYRQDIVNAVTQRTILSKRQPHGVSQHAGYQTAASSWGTGRAVARVPRVPGGGSHRSGQAAFANFCRGGGMFEPKKTWRRWTRKTNKNELRHAQAFAYSAAGCTSLVEARGHMIENIPEFPLVVDDSIQSLKKTKQMKEALVALGCEAEVDKCAKKRARAGKGKRRNRKYLTRRGPLIVHDGSETESLLKVTNVLRGVDCMRVEMPSVTKLAPGGQGGRLCIFTKSAFEKLTEIWGNEQGISLHKAGYKLPRCVTSANIRKVMRSEAIQSALRPMVVPTYPSKSTKRNLWRKEKKALAKKK